MKNNKKGFTIVELVIVIAVIAILAGVLIPTFASVITKANESKALQEAQNAYKEAYALAIADGEFAEGGDVVPVGGYQFTFTGELDNPTVDVKVLASSDAYDDGYTVTVDNGVVKLNKVEEGTATENATYTNS